MSATHTPTPWRACKEGNCPCSMIWSEPADHPVCDVTRGKWGDSYPALRIVGTSSFDQKAEPYIDRIDYGEVADETASANAAFIVRACNAHDELVAALKDCLAYLLSDAFGQSFLIQKVRAALAKAGAA